MKLTLHALFLSAALAVTGCGGHGAHITSKGGVDTVYTEAKAMSIHLVDPERAFLMIDSAVIVGNISRERGEYLKAVTQYGEGNYPLSRQTCLNLLDAPDSLTLMDTYALLVAIESHFTNNAAVIRYATEASRLAHHFDNLAEMGRMEATIAGVMSSMGKDEEGILRLRTVIEEMSQIDSFDGVNAYHYTTLRLLHILLENKRHAEIVPLCESLLQRIDELGEHPERFTMKEGFDPSEFVDFARGQTLAFLTTAYARQYSAAKEPPTEMTAAARTQLLRKARETEAEMFKTKWSHTIDCDRMMTAAYHHLGQFERFDEAMSRLDATMTDTINRNYLIRLHLCCNAAKMRGRTAEALDYLERAITIRDSLDVRNQRDQLNELAAVYHLQEEQLSRYEAEAEAERSHIINIALASGLLAAIAFLVYFFRQKRIIDKKNRVLARQITEIINLSSPTHGPSPRSLTPHPSLSERGVYTPSAENPTVKSDPSSPSQGGVGGGSIGVGGEASAGGAGGGTSDAALFQHLRSAILRDQLFLDPQLDRQQLVDRFGLSKERIGAAFAKGSPYKSLIDFLTDCRLPYAARLLTDRPDLTIAEVARESGFPSMNTFGRNFKQKYALTPSQFREQQNSL